ncbi:hypothetical protein [Ancylomarina euxinus]|nr:hypothetical protein [Ancylomarina euxinus]MCZ4693468.1 hypothetical protein [Ancylomarina euxinus]MUP13695.1 hypothetical protein [Ancylomarina euxinus]
MKKKLPIPILLVLFCCLTMPFKSCVDSDDYDFDKLSDKVDWQPNFVAPVGYGEYNLWYLLNQHEAVLDDQTIVLGEDGLIHIKYMEKDIFSYEASEVLGFPDQSSNFLNLDLNVPAIGIPSANLPQIVGPFPETFSVSTDDAAVILKEVNVNSVLNFTLSNPLNTEVDLKVSLLSGTKDGSTVVETYVVAANAVAQTESLDLTNLIIQFEEPLTVSNFIEISFEATIKPNTGTVTGTGDLNIQYQVGNIELIMAKGDFGDQTIDIGSGDIDLGVDFWDDIDGNFTFADPRINIKFDNEVGVPFLVTANMTASNSDGLTLSLDPDNQLPNYPKTEAEVLAGIEASILYNKDNSGIVDFMALPPSGNISYSGSVRINQNLDGTRYNPLAVGNNINIVSGNSSISAELEMDIPMDFKADNLSISDTINEIDINDADKMLKAAIIITSENGLPLDVKIENIFFTDAAYIVLSTISNESIIKAAGVTVTGEVDPSTITKEVSRIELTEAQIKSLNDTENIIIKAVLSTYDEGKQSVKLQGTDKLKFSIAVNAQLDLSN